MTHADPFHMGIRALLNPNSKATAALDKYSTNKDIPLRFTPTGAQSQSFIRPSTGPGDARPICWATLHRYFNHVAGPDGDSTLGPPHTPPPRPLVPGPQFDCRLESLR